MFRECVVIGAGLLLASCLASPGEPNPKTTADGGTRTTPDDAGTGNADGGPSFARSEKARVRFKRVYRLAADLSAALEIPSSMLCAELGIHDCFGVHGISLGGVEPYGASIYAPLDNTTVTSPLAVERISLSACAKRVDEDAGAAEGLIFKDIALDSDGKLVNPSAPEVTRALEVLIERLLHRRATTGEVETLRSFYDEVLTNNGPQPARAWAILSCFSIATSMEALFY